MPRPITWTFGWISSEDLGSRVQRVAREKPRFTTRRNTSSGITVDLSPAFTVGIQEHFPQADIPCDYFYLIKLANEAADEVRRQESRDMSQLRGHSVSVAEEPTD